MNRNSFLAAVGLLICLALPSNSLGDIVVTNSDFVGNDYTYSLNPGSTSSFSSTHTNALNSTSNAHFGPSFHLPTLYYYFNGTTPNFTYRWDFSSSPKPQMVTITDRLTLFTNITINRAKATVSYSTNGVDYSPVRELLTPTDGSIVADSILTYDLGLGGTDEFYYRVEMIPVAGDANGSLDSYQDQWARTSLGSTFPGFSATFSVVPEPSGLVLCFLAFVGTIVARQRSQR